MPKVANPRIVTLLDDVEKCEKEVSEALLSLADKKPVRVIINSGGGSVYSSLGMATIIQMKQLQAEAVVLADCSSSALLVFAVCQRRIVAPHASFLFHPMSWSSDDQSRLPGAKSWAAEFQRVNQVYEDWLVRNLSLPRRLLKTWIRDERYVLAQELIDLGVAEPLDLAAGKVIEIAGNTKKTSRSRVAEKPARIRRIG